jgi:hypothetical protein
MQFLDSSRRIIQSREVIDYLHRAVLAEPAITSVAAAIEPDPQLWGSSALHFSARHTDTGAPALLKLNVPADQLWWTRQLARAYPDLIPLVYASGDLAVAGLGWVLWERVEGGLHPGWHGREFDMLLEAGVAFQRASRTLADAAREAGVLHTLRIEDLAEGLEQGLRQAAPGPAGQVLSRLATDWAWVSQVCDGEVCHGDLHMANALCRDEPPGGVALLIDHHPMLQPWAYEAAKPEILNADPARAGCRGLVARQAAMRARLGMTAPAGAELARVQAIVLGWWAIQLWGYIGESPDPAWRDPRIWRAENETYITAAARA